MRNACRAVGAHGVRTKRWAPLSIIHYWMHDDASSTIRSLKKDANSWKPMDQGSCIPSVPLKNVRLEAQIRGTIPRMGIGLEIHQFADMNRSFTVDDVSMFASLTGDSNPIHQTIDSNVENHPLILGRDSANVKENNDSVKPMEQERRHDGVLVPGMLVGSIFSAMIGTLIPGAVYLSQSLDFRKPLFTEKEVIGRIVVTKLRHFPKRNGLIMICDTLVQDSSNGTTPENGVEKDECMVLLRGSASIWIPNGLQK